MLQHLKIEDNAIIANPYQKFCCLGLKLKNYFNFFKKKERRKMKAKSWVS